MRLGRRWHRKRQPRSKPALNLNKADTGLLGPAAPVSLVLGAISEDVPLSARRQELQGRLGTLRGVQLAQARFELARLFLADGLAAEALAVLDAGAEADRAGGDGLLRGAAEVLLGRPQRALELLDSADGNAEHAVWQAAARADAEDWPAAAERLHHAGDAWAGYRLPLRLALGLRVAAALAQTGQAQEALKVLERLGELPLDPQDRARLALVRGMALEASPNTAQAAAGAFDVAARNGDLVTRVSALFAAEEAARKHGRLSDEEALRQLLAQRPLWRGHLSEAAMLDSLADLHWTLGDSGSAFAAWNSALALQPKEALRAAIQARARGALMALLRGERDTNPVLALAVYRQHADLLAGQEKDAVAMLAARLAEAGLPGFGTRIVGSAALDPAAPSPATRPDPTGLTPVSQLKDQLAQATRPLSGTADEVTNMLTSRIDAVRAGLAQARTDRPAPAASAM